MSERDDAFFDSLREGRMLIPAVELDMANPAWSAASARILIVRLSPWRDVDISTPHLVLFDEMRRELPDAYLDFAFLPPAADRRALSARGLPWFFGRASRRSPRDFDLVMISNAFALELVNLPHFFSTSGLPASAAARAALDDIPTVIAGGSNASAMGALVLRGRERAYPAEDAFTDGIFFGEGETAIGPLARILSGNGAEETRRSSGPAAGRSSPARRARLLAAASIRGFWPCLLAGGARKAIAPGRPHTVTRPLVLNGPAASSARLSITSGCPGYCSFCLEGWDRRPYAEADFDRLLAEAKELRRSSGAVDLEIYSFNFNTHSRIFDLVFELNRVFRRVSFMSQRLDILARTRGLADAEIAAGKRSFTLGIEGVSAAMRAYFRKGLSEADIDACLDATLRSGVKELKLFFIIAGTETPEDTAEFEALMERIEEKKNARAPSARILVSAGYLVRLPFTPLQYAPLEFDREKLIRVAGRLRDACESAGIEFRLASEPEECFVDQALSLGGDAVYRWLERSSASGFVYDGSLGEGVWKSLKPYVLDSAAGKAFREEKGADYRPPLSFIEEERGYEALYRHYRAAKNLEDRPSCLGSACTDCGVCAGADERKAMTGHRFAAPPTIRHAERIAALVAAKNAFVPRFVAFDIPEDLAGASPEYLSSWLLRAFSRRAEGAENVVFEAREVLFSGTSPFSGLLGPQDRRCGKSAAALFGPDPARLESLAARIAKTCSLALLAAPPEPAEVDLELRVKGENLAAAKRAFEDYLAGQKLSFTARREGALWRYDMTKASRNRRMIVGAEIHPRGDEIVLSMKAGERATLAPLLEALGGTRGTAPAARIVGWS